MAQLAQYGHRNRCRTSAPGCVQFICRRFFAALQAPYGRFSSHGTPAYYHFGIKVLVLLYPECELSDSETDVAQPCRHWYLGRFRVGSLVSIPDACFSSLTTTLCAHETNFNEFTIVMKIAYHAEDGLGRLLPLCMSASASSLLY